MSTKRAGRNGRTPPRDVDRRDVKYSPKPVSAGCITITGGAGFVGTNLADRLLIDGERVRIVDDLSRRGVEDNLEWLRKRHRRRLQFIKGDIRNFDLVRAAIDGSSFVFHLAAQVAVTTSLLRPLEDHAINVNGTLNVLEAIRRSKHRPGLMLASTNKVYGSLPDIEMRRVGKRWLPANDGLRTHGISEQRPLDFISPYGCSKGAADQYVLDYCRSYGLAATVLRMSCIYGMRQHANSDQGWVAHFLRTAIAGDTLTIFGDGHQVRDVLYIDDFIAALLAVRREIGALSGRAFNIGGGPANTLSLLEMIDIAAQLDERPMDVQFGEPRPGDQLYFAADHRRFTAATQWRPHVSPERGIEQVWSWLRARERPQAPAVLQRHENLA